MKFIAIWLGHVNGLSVILLSLAGTDHVHILCLLSKKISLVRLMTELKAHSSKWIKTKDESLKNFYWLDGYGAFSINPSEADIVSSYTKKST
jgi:putative transposase